MHPLHALAQHSDSVSASEYQRQIFVTCQLFCNLYYIFISVLVFFHGEETFIIPLVGAALRSMRSSHA